MHHVSARGASLCEEFTPYPVSGDLISICPVCYVCPYPYGIPDGYVLDPWGREMRLGIDIVTVSFHDRYSCCCTVVPLSKSDQAYVLGNSKEGRSHPGIASRHFPPNNPSNA